MKTSLAIRPARLSELSQHTNLLNSYYNRKKKTEYFKWQYFSSPYPSVLMSAFDNDRLVGMFGLQKKLLSCGAFAGEATDLLVEKSWRGKGVFHLLAKAAFAYFTDLDLVLSFTNLNGKKACQKLGLRSLSRIDSMGILTNTIKTNSKMAQKRKKSSNLVQFVYNKRIRDWRYKLNPIYKYNRVFLGKSFTFTKIFKDPADNRLYGDIVDYEFEPNTPEILQKLFVKSCESLFIQRVEMVTTWALPKTIAHNVLKNLGFLDIYCERYLCILILDKSYNYLYDFDSWHLVQADSEVY